jgi:hypothetical protein
MPASPGRNEEVFIRLFVSAYENFSWSGSQIDFPDQEKDGAIDGLIKRADGKTMAIEHTLIQPFVDDREDFAAFKKVFPSIEDDQSLAVADTEIIVYVPVGILHYQKSAQQDLIVKSIRSWIANNRLSLHEGKHEYQCDVMGMQSVTLTVGRNKLDVPGTDPGSVVVRRQQMKNDLNEVIEKALRKKLPKLEDTKADRHVLFLERDQFTFHPDLMFTEIERQRLNFPLLEKIDEIWHVETVNYHRFGSLYFEQRKGNKVMTSMLFDKYKLVTHYKNGMPYKECSN